MDTNELEKENFTNLFGQEAIAKLKEMAEKIGNCLFVTNLGNFPTNARPMALQKVEADGSLWFLSGRNSQKNRDIIADNKVSLYFQNSSNYEFVSIDAIASIHYDKQTIEKYWTSFANAWFDGPDDINVSVICVMPTNTNYWSTKNGKVMSFIKMSLNAITGIKGDDGGVQGALKV